MIFGELEMTQIGHLADAPSFRQNPDGSKVANFRLITNIGWKDRTSGDFKDRAEGFQYELWGDGADHIKNLPKGGHLYVVSEPYNHRFMDPETRTERHMVRFRVTKWRSLDRKPGNAASDPAAGGDAGADDGEKVAF
jgi:single-stranded DNA-binding protein